VLGEVLAVCSEQEAQGKASSPVCVKSPVRDLFCERVLHQDSLIAQRESFQQRTLARGAYTVLRKQSVTACVFTSVDLPTFMWTTEYAIVYQHATTSLHVEQLPCMSSMLVVGQRNARYAITTHGNGIKGSSVANRACLAVGITPRDT
jgi:hypothetical protein